MYNCSVRFLRGAARLRKLKQADANNRAMILQLGRKVL